MKRAHSDQQSHSYITDMNGGGIELVVPQINVDNISIGSRRESLTSKETPVKFKKQPQDIANEIDRKCRIIFPLSFLIINIIYWTILALLSYYY